MSYLARPLTELETDKIAAIVMFMSGESNSAIERYNGNHHGKDTPIIGIFEDYLEAITADEIVNLVSCGGVILVTLHKINFQDLRLFLKTLSLVNRLASSPVLTNHTVQIHRICKCREVSPQAIVSIARDNGLFAIHHEMFQ